MPDKVKIVWKENDFIGQYERRRFRMRVAWMRYEGFEYPLCKATNYGRKTYWYLSWFREEYEEVDTIGNELAWNRNKDFTVNAGAGQYIYYAIPAAWGTPTFFVGGFEGGFDLLSKFNFTNASGYTTSYNVYKSGNANLGQTTVNVK